MKTNGKNYIKECFPELTIYPIRNSRKYEAKEKKGYLDDWLFRFDLSLAEKHEFIILAGALDYANKDFKIIKVPTKFLLESNGKLDVDTNGQFHIYIHIRDLIDLRNHAGLSFQNFAVN